MTPAEARALAHVADLVDGVAEWEDIDIDLSGDHGWVRIEATVPIDALNVSDSVETSVTPEQAVGDGGVQPYPPQHTTVAEAVAGDPAVHDADEHDTADEAAEDDAGDDLVDACPECDSTTVNARTTKPKSERWKCYDCGHTYAESHQRPPKPPGQKTDADDTETHECDTCGFVAKDAAGLKRHQNTKGHLFNGPTPPWLARNPNDILADADTTRDLPQLIEAVSSAEDVRRVTQALAMVDAGQCREQVLQPLGLIAQNGKLIADDLLDERLTVIGEWVDE